MPEPDKSLGQKILNFFVKEEVSGVAAGTPAAPTPTTPRPAAPNAPTPGPAQPIPPAPVGTGAVDPKFAEHLANVLAQNNPPGPDYFEYRETLRSLANLGLPEDKQYQAAWASFKALGGSSDIAALTKTANQYIAALNNDRDAFAKSVDAALADRVGGLQNEQKRLQTENEALAKQLVEIQQKISANTDRLTAIGGEITDQSGKITQNRQNYEVTFSHYTEQIKNDITKITQYLK
ncbi:hypothetical protein G8759_18735 [Spirosoma aureum]|uniref:Uncharacterized protein n=1 Tax=Spirosoma aureum TaxID=2692134 RepID=A0A6G9AQ89_9BACT|nr:hypothetical protein [Spirosoma aureum]QIP14506.1 hypothetical protein G8759_18735 [Spirosoma aureum]